MHFACDECTLLCRVGLLVAAVSQSEDSASAWPTNDEPVVESCPRHDLPVSNRNSSSAAGEVDLKVCSSLLVTREDDVPSCRSSRARLFLITLRQPCSLLSSTRDLCTTVGPSALHRRRRLRPSHTAANQLWEPGRPGILARLRRSLTSRATRELADCVFKRRVSMSERDFTSFTVLRKG